jgi:hypothetical protein
MPPAKRAQPKSGSSAKTTTGRAAPKRSTAAASAGRSGSAGSSAKTGTAAKASTTARASAAGSASAKRGGAVRSPEAALEATAERVRKLNERIISAGKQTGESTLTSYEKALKAIASAVERGPGSSEIDWVSQLATAQAKFLREFTEAWTSAARGMLK